MTAVTIRGTFLKDSRPNNGLETIADDLIADKTRTHYVVGIVKWAGGNVAEDGGLTPAVRVLAIEPLTGEEAGRAAALLDGARKARGLGRMEDLTPEPDPTLFDFDGPDDGEPRRVGEVRLGPDGEHEVPEASAEELAAEAEEARAAGVPSATFSGGDD
jgi:hypothetical protein